MLILFCYILIISSKENFEFKIDDLVLDDDEECQQDESDFDVSSPETTRVQLGTTQVPTIQLETTQVPCYAAIAGQKCFLCDEDNVFLNEGDIIADTCDDFHMNRGFKCDTPHGEEEEEA